MRPPLNLFFCTLPQIISCLFLGLYLLAQRAVSLISFTFIMEQAGRGACSRAHKLFKGRVHVPGVGVGRADSTSGTNPRPLIPGGSTYPKPAPLAVDIRTCTKSWHLCQRRPQGSHVPHGSASLAQSPGTPRHVGSLTECENHFPSSRWALSSCFPTPMRQIGFCLQKERCRLDVKKHLELEIRGSPGLCLCA